MEFILNANLVEVNRYDFVVDATNKEEAEAKLKKFLKVEIPYPQQDKAINGVRCFDVIYGNESINLKEPEINAKLIAAAPELLEALQDAYKCSGEKNYLTKSVLDNMLNAIKKATE